MWRGDEEMQNSRILSRKRREHRRKETEEELVFVVDRESTPLFLLEAVCNHDTH